jgi:hypothetical protein
MKQTELQKILKREPFRPFGVRLSNGRKYEFLEARDLGAPRKVTHTIYYFGESESVLIDVENITEVFNP